MKAIEMRKKSVTELNKELGKWREKVSTLVRERPISESKNVREIRGLRKDIARALTIISEKKREEK